MSIDTTTERIPLSFNQEFLCMFDKGDREGPFGPEYIIVCGWRVHGVVDPEKLQGALDDLVERHESLRTLVVRDGETRYQRILPPSSPHLEVRDLPPTAPAERDRRAEELLIEMESGAYGISEPPLVRAVLARFDPQDAVLVLIAHHSAVDEWSTQLMIRDLAACYAERSGHGPRNLPETVQYREYAVWERANADTAAVDRAREYWRNKLSGARIFPMRTDHLRSEGLPKRTAAHRFLIDADLTSRALRIARSVRSTPFIFLLAVYKVLLREMFGSTDIVVPTLTLGRSQARFHETVGSFFNYVPLRTDLAGCENFRDVIARTRRTCLEAYANDIPFSRIVAEAPGLVESFAGDDRAVFAFQVHQFPFVMKRERIGDLEYSDLRRRVLSQDVSTDIPDGALWTLGVDPSGEIIGNLGFNTNLFEKDTIVKIAQEYRRVLRELVADPDAPLKRI
ncbi:condensation domain-containing protein [Thermostaphylospora chromogena]|uniref:Condensation domain-containing protein n=1 Tax=Thermostaphylospora chromogena TaxID=35622 RepID=A0A1H0ZTR2_9ACTN|nr:condensation domain-containing protein [Thermostaphylospora chromogena]SDQ30752.1 Condensation domain-containing protein [Thermostaphylospora chromogena]